MKLEGVVRWFCNTSGDGIVSGIDGNDYYLHWSAVQGKFEQKNGKKSWVELESGWKVEFEVLSGFAWAQVNKLWIIEKAEPIPIPSAFIDREAMKAKIAAANAMFDEAFPQDPVDADEYYKLTRTSKKLSKKQQKRLDDLLEMSEQYSLRLKAHNDHNTKVICSIYREHSRFELLRKA
jgi:cold shock CspA family protein